MALIIQSGFAKGMALNAPEGLKTRPTSAKVRAAIANMLEPYATNGVVADICAGSGAIGLELVSRGAKGALFIENDRSAHRCLAQNISLMRERAIKNHRPSPQLACFNIDASKDLTAAFNGHQVDCFWIDPPYARAVELTHLLVQALPLFAAQQAILAIESDLADCAAIAALAKGSGLWTLLKQKHYGQTGVSLFSLGIDGQTEHFADEGGGGS